MARRDNIRERISAAAFRLFRQKGFLRSGVDEIADAAGVTKRTLYAHFGSKDELLARVMATQAELALDVFRSDFAPDAGNAREIVATLFRDLGRWASTPRWAGPGYSRLAAELADLPGHPARAIARRHKSELETLLAGRLASAGVDDSRVLARQIWLLMEGAMMTMLIHGDPVYIDAAADAALVLLAGRAECAGTNHG